VPVAHLTLLSKPGCHLCDVAREVVTAVVADIGSDTAPASVVVDEQSILDDQELLDRYVDEIPVVLINGKVHNIWRIDPARLKSALLEATA
jgi:glutaredoxin